MNQKKAEEKGLNLKKEPYLYCLDNSIQFLSLNRKGKK